uniref:Pentacotripeptide-repeat region of PRORP domain-containing protein n=2 Tax=Physcomitrium patens TaxID=3218 RepID=A0A2K1KZQ3_PHYPA|nr:hypothetical protein PHYPA_002040 [Physcomitrium patens]
MAHIMRLLCRGYFIEQHHLVSASSWHLSHVSSLGERGKGILPNMLTYKPIMSCLAKKVKVDQFHELAKWIEEAVVPSDGSNSSLSRLHQKRPSSLDGINEQQMGFYLNVYIQGVSQVDKISQGLDLLDEMQARELEPSSFSLSPFISEFEWKTMIDEDGYILFPEMKKLGVDVNTYCYNLLFSALLYRLYTNWSRDCGLCWKSLGIYKTIYTQEWFDGAPAVMKEMDATGVKPDVHAYRLLIFACSLSKDEDRADQVPKRGIRPNESIYTVVIIVYSECGNVDRGIVELRKKWETAGIEAKSAVLHGISVTGRVEEALDLYAAFKMEHAALGKVGNLNRMFEVFEDARGADKWNFMNLRQHAEHLNVRCLNAVLACIHHNQLGYGYVMLG